MTLTDSTPRMFGAKGDGTTDDSAAIQAAINATAGGTVYFPAGVYKCNTGLTASSHAVSLVGEGHEQSDLAAGSIIKAGATMTNLFAATGDGFFAQRMSFDGNGQATNTLSLSAAQPRILECHVRRPATNGTALNVASGASSPWITNTRINGANQAGTVGLLIDDTDATIIGTKAVNVETSFKLTSNASGTKIVGCHNTPGVTIGKNCIWVSGHPANVTIASTRFDNVGLGSPLQFDPDANELNATVSGCTFYITTITDATFAAIGVDTTAAGVSQLVIVGNTMATSTSNRFKYGLAAQTRAGATATNTGRLASTGTIFSDNAVYASTAIYSHNPMVARGNVYSADRSSYAAATDV